MNSESEIVDWRHDVWRRAIHSFGTGYIFEQRAESLAFRTKFLAFLGIALPLSVGGLYLSSANTEPWFAALVVVVGVAGVFQLLGSAWSLVSHWDTALAYAHESSTHNARLARAFESIAREAPHDHALRLQILNAEYDAREQQDIKHSVSDKERRRGLRAALRQFERKCSRCGQVPGGMKTTTCEVCGNF